MAVPESLERPRTGDSPPVERARRLFAEAEAQEGHLDRSRYLEALRSALAYVEQHRRELDPAAAEIASRLDETALAFYRLSETDLAAKAVETGLGFAPGSSALLHRKALILLAQNRDVESALTLVDQALEANPHDKTVWATRGDALRLLNRPAEAAAAYLRAQRLDATSTQYVERALRTDPKNSEALRLKLQLARAHGGDQQALDACEALLVTHPDDADLLLARAELLASLGRSDDALAAFGRASERRPDDARLRFLIGKEQLRRGRESEALAEFARILDGAHPADGPTLADIADLLGDRPTGAEIALRAREALRTAEPSNLANLQALCTLAKRAERFESALVTARAILAISPDHLEAMRTIAELEIASGRLDAGFEAYRALLRAHPHESVAARTALAAAEADHRTDLIAEFGQSILAENPDDREALTTLARTYAAARDWSKAVDAVDALLKGTPGDLELLLEKKRLLAELQDTEALGAVLDELFRLDPTRYDLALERGHHYLAVAYDRAEGSGERESAARAALVAYERSSVDPTLAAKSLLGIARASRLIRDSHRAITSYEQFLTTPGQEKRADVRKELGHVLRETGRLAEAEHAYAEAIELGLEDLDLFWGETEVLAALNQDAKALRFVDLLLHREPQNPLFLRRRGQLLLKAQRRPEALEALTAAVAVARGDPNVHFDVAGALRAHGLYPEAIQYYRQGLEIEPKSRGGRVSLAETLNLAGRSNEAAPLVDALLREDPNDLAAWRARADAARALGRPGDLAYSLKAILLLEPHNPAALQEKARLHLDAGEKSEAYDCLAQLVDEGGADLRDPAVHLQLGDLAAELGRVEEANRAYERAAQLDPSQLSEIAVRRGRLRLTAGRPDLALEVLDQTLGALPAGAPRSTSALLLRAEVLSALERASEAQQVLEEVRQREPTSPVATAGIARSLLDQGKHAEAKEFLRTALPQVAAQPPLFLLLAEAEAGLGSIPDAIATVKRGLEALPKATVLWVRLGELSVAQEAWPDAATAYAHALALNAANPDLHLKAGFVAERMGHPNEALELYDRATQIAPGDKQAWTSRGVALLATGRPDEAQASFDRALAIDSDFDAAKEGRKTALQRTRESQVERFGRDALLLESRLKRPVAKNDLFVTLHVPFDLLEPVLAALARDPGVRLDRLSEAEVRDLESASYQLIVAALEQRPEGMDRRGLTLSDVAALSPSTATLGQIQRQFGYLRAVLEADLRPENLRLTPDVEDLARRALTLPEHQRTLFELVRTLKVGLFRARIIKVVESSGSAVHAPLPSLDLGAFTPEFRPSDGTGPEFFAPENVPAPTAPEPARAAHAPRSPTAPGAVASVGDHRQARCVGCGGIAAIVHNCGAPICTHCIAEFHTCPKCAHPVDAGSSRPVGTPAHGGPLHDPARPAPTSPLRSVFSRKPAAAKSGAPRAAAADRPHPEPAPAKGDVAPPGAKPAEAPAPPVAPPVPKPPRRDRTDDEPRL